MNDEKRDKAFKNLANAIVFQAVRDYREAILYNDPKPAKTCERFFKSDWCKFLTQLNGENLAEKLRTETLCFKNRACKIFDKKQDQNDTEPTEQAFKCPTCREWVDVTFGYISRKAKSTGYFARCRSCGLEYKRKIEGDLVRRRFYD